MCGYDYEAYEKDILVYPFFTAQVWHKYPALVKVTEVASNVLQELGSGSQPQPNAYSLNRAGLVVQTAPVSFRSLEVFIAINFLFPSYFP